MIQCNKYLHYYISFLIHGHVAFPILVCFFTNHNNKLTFIWCCFVLYIHFYFLNTKNKDTEKILSFSKIFIYADIIAYSVILCIVFVRIAIDFKNSVYKCIYDVKLEEDKINEKDNC